jgi:hypothetical protein
MGDGGKRGDDGLFTPLLWYYHPWVGKEFVLAVRA